MERLQNIVRLVVLSCGLLGCTMNAGLETAVSQSDEPRLTKTPAATLTPISEMPVPEDCPITQSPMPPFVPPEPYNEVPPNGEFWYGTNQLWTVLWPDGTWEQLPKPDEGYVNKLIWFREGYVWTEETKPVLTISARQLNGDGVVEPFTDATNGFQKDYESFMLTGIALPNLGCWEISGEYEGHTLSYVVWVRP